jgi:hypothetical protein
MSSQGAGGAGGGSGGSGGSAGGPDIWSRFKENAVKAGKSVGPVLKDLLGPMALLYIAADKFSRGLLGAARNAREMAKALQASETGRRMEIEFKKLTGSVAQARDMVKSLARQAQTLPFSFEALGQAQKNMMVFSNGAMKSARDLRAVADAAVAAGAPIDAVASAMGAMRAATAGQNFDRWRDGVAQAASELSSMGVISQSVARRLREMQDSGATGGEMWAVVQRELKASEGAAAALTGTITGMQQQLANVETEGVAEVGRAFESAEKAALRSQLAMAKFGAEVDKAVAQSVSPIFTAWEMMKEKFVVGVTQMGQSLGFLTKYFATAAVGITVGFYAVLGLMVGKIVWAIAGIKALDMALKASLAGGLKWLSFVNPLSAGLNFLIAGFALAAVKIMEVRGRILAVGEAMKQAAAERAGAMGAFKEQGASIRTEGDRNQVLRDIEAEMDKTRQGIAEQEMVVASKNIARDKAQAAVDDDFNFNPLVYNDLLGATSEADGANKELAAREAYLSQLALLHKKILSIESASLAKEAEINNQIRQQAQMKEEIMLAGRKRMAGILGGEEGYEAARKMTEEIQGKLTSAENFQKTKNRDDAVVGTLQDDLRKASGGKGGDVAALTELMTFAGNSARNEASAISAKLSAIEHVREKIAKLGALSEEEIKAQASAGSAPFVQLEDMVRAVGGWDAISAGNVQDLENQRKNLMETNDPLRWMQEMDGSKQAEQAAGVRGLETFSRVEDSERAFRLEQMIAQLKVDGLNATKTEAQLRQAAAEEILAKEERALAATERMIAAQKAGDQRAQNRAEAEAARFGGGGRSAAELRASVAQMREDEEMRKKQMATTTQGSAQGVQLATLRTQERFARTGEDRKQAQGAADALQEEIRKKEIFRELSSQMPGASAETIGEMAANMAKAERLETELGREGTPDMGSMAAIGGSAGWAGVVGSSKDKMDQLRTVMEKVQAAAEKTEKDMAAILAANQEGLALAKAAAESD